MMLSPTSTLHNSHRVICMVLYSLVVEFAAGDVGSTALPAQLAACSCCCATARVACSVAVAPSWACAAAYSTYVLVHSDKVLYSTSSETCIDAMSSGTVQSRHCARRTPNPANNLLISFTYTVAARQAGRQHYYCPLTLFPDSNVVPYFLPSSALLCVSLQHSYFCVFVRTISVVVPRVYSLSIWFLSWAELHQRPQN